jgi:hypothetical protein
LDVVATRKILPCQKLNPSCPSGSLVTLLMQSELNQDFLPFSLLQSSETTEALVFVKNDVIVKCHY